MAKEIEEGALVEIVKAYSGDDWPNPRAVGTRFVVEYVISDEDSDDGVGFVNGSGLGGWGNIDAPESSLKIVLSRKEMENAPDTPSMAELIQLIQNNIHDDFNGVTIDETYASPGDKERGILEFSGVNEYGFRYNATLRIVSLEAD